MHQMVKSFGFCGKIKKPVIFIGLRYNKKGDWPHILICVYLLKHSHFKFGCEQQYWEGFGIYFVHMQWLYIAVVAFFEVY